MKNLCKLGLLAAACCGSAAIADDVEIYFNTSPDAEGAPLVMFSLDYRSNLGSTICQAPLDAAGARDFSACGWNDDAAFAPVFNALLATPPGEGIASAADDGVVQFFDLLRAALQYVFEDPEIAQANMHLGLMLNHDNINNCANKPDVAGCSNGGYIAMGLTPFDDGGKEGLLEKLNAVPVPQGNLSHSFQGKELYFELFRYLTGQGIYNGHVGFTDYGDPCTDDNLNDSTNDSCLNGSDDDHPLIAWDTAIEKDDGTRYVSPFADDSLQCSSVHVLNFMFGVSNQDADSDDAIEANKGDGGLAIDLSGGKDEFNQVIGLLRDTDWADGSWGDALALGGEQNVTSHFVYNGANSNTINGYALAGGGRAIEVSDDPRVLIEALKNTFLSIIRQTSTFEAPAVTVNSYNRLAHRDEVYYALFGPELNRDWPGNLKKYRFGEVPIDDDGDGITDWTRVAIMDSNGIEAIDANGLFHIDACSFWSDCSTKPDGDAVAKGGAAERLTTLRKVYTYVGDGVDPAAPVTLSGAGHALHEDNDAITAEMLGLLPGNVGDYDGDGDTDDADLAAARQAVLRIGRGVDEQDTGIALRTLGDPIHSRPAVIIYDGDVSDPGDVGANPDLVIGVTTNEGYFHLIDADTGDEVFSFVPKETLPLLWQINKDPNPSGTGGSRYDTYGLDASPVVLWKDGNGDDVIAAADGDRVIVYLGQRRGGRNLYAMDITDRSAPKLLWHIEGGVTPGFEELGQTWSEPTLTRVRVKAADGTVSESDVLVFGGGYDEDRYDRDADDPDDGIDTGRAVYVVDALTGQRRWAIGPDDSYDLALASLQDSVPAQVRVLDLGDDGTLDRLYFSDIAGRVFRVDFDNSGEQTTLYGGGLLATLTDPAACDWAVTPNSCRRFYNSPDIAVMTGFPISPYIQIALGSGFRAHPKDRSIQDRFYVLYDENVVNPIASDDFDTVYGVDGFTETDNLVNVTILPAGGTYSAMASTLQGQLLGADIHGWYLDMQQPLGEKVISESLTIGGLIIFTTYMPADPNALNICNAGIGTSRVYLVNAFNGLPVANLGDANVALFAPGDAAESVEASDRYVLLPREGMPTDPAIVFKQKDDGSIEPNLVIGTQMPLPSELLSIDVLRRTWWLEE